MGDTVQYAFEGLVVGYEKFELGRQDNFTTYAPWWIRQNLHRTIDICRGLHTPAYLDEKLMLLRDAFDNHFCEECIRHDICPNLVSFLASEMNESLENVISYMRMMEEPLQLDELIETESIELMTWTNDELIDEVSYWDLCDKVKYILSTLKPRECEIMTIKYGLDDGREKTLEEVGGMFRLTRERIRQIEAKALEKLRHPSRSKKLEDYTEIDFPIILSERYERKVLFAVEIDDDIFENYSKEYDSYFEDTK